MKRIHRINGSCAIFALSHVSGRPEAAVIEVCKDHDFEWGQGMADDEIMAAAKDLDITKREIQIKKCSLKEFLKKYNSGMYLLATWNHIFAVNNGGILVRPDIRPPASRCVIHRAWRVS